MGGWVECELFSFFLIQLFGPPQFNYITTVHRSEEIKYMRKTVYSNQEMLFQGEIIYITPTMENVDEELPELFNSACNFVKTVSGTLGSDRLLYLYARYKQVFYLIQYTI